MPLTPGPQPYRSNFLNEIKNRLGIFVPSGSTSVGAVLLKELLQNADDAGATELLVILDHREAPAGLEGGDLTAPGLLVANDGPFEDEHFEAITEVASGQKLVDPAATGRFGVGFTSVYLIGDSCALLSSKYLVVFDLLQRVMPHLGRLDGSGRTAKTQDAIWSIEVDQEKRGKWHADLPRVLSHAFVTDSFPEQLKGASPVAKALACGDYDRVAAFRIPFRSGGEKGLYSERHRDHDARERLFVDMVQAARSSFIFLRHVQTVRFATVQTDGNMAIGTAVTITAWPDTSSTFFRGLGSGTGTHSSGIAERTVAENGRVIAKSLVGLQVRFPPIGDEARRQDPFGGLMLGNRGWSKAVPVAGAAVAVAGDTREDEPWRVGLPLIDSGPCGALLHGGFFLDQARRAPTFLRGVEGETRWNKEIVAKLIVPMLVDLLQKASNKAPPDLASSLRLLDSIPTFTSSDPEKTDSLSEFTAAEFHRADWSLKLVDARGEAFEFSRALLFPSGNAGGLIIQEVDELLAPVLALLPSGHAQRQVRYVKKQVFAAIRKRFPSAIKTWCRSAAAIDAAALISVLRNAELPDHANEALLDGLVRRLANTERTELQDAQLDGAFLFWSDLGPVKQGADTCFVSRTTDASGAFKEVIDVLGLGVQGLQRVVPGVGAADPKVARRLGLTNVHTPTDETLLWLLERVAPSENRHDRFEPKELVGAVAFWSLLIATAQRSPESVNKLHLAWTVCRDGENAEPLMNAVVVVHSTMWLDGHHHQLWDQLIEQAFPRVHPPLLAKSHVAIHESYKQQRPTCFDMPDECELVRTFPNELLGWASKLYWQRQNVERQIRIIRAFAEVVEVLASRSRELGPDAFIAACSRFQFFTYEKEFLRSLPVHRLEGGARTALYLPNPLGDKGNLSQRFRLKPSGQVAEPPGVDCTFQLLDPPQELRSFYSSTLGIPEQAGRLAVSNLLFQMRQPPPNREVHAARLRYLAANYWSEFIAAEGSPEQQRALKEALDAALLVPATDGSSRLTRDVEVAGPAEQALLSIPGWTQDEARRVMQAAASPKRIAELTEDEAQDLGAMNVALASIGIADLRLRALTSDSHDLTLRDRLRLLDAFDAAAPPVAKIGLSEVFLSFPVPLLGGERCSLRESELLPTDIFGLSQEVVSAFFPGAIDVEALSRESGVNADRLREVVLPILDKAPLPFQSAGKRVRDGLATLWSHLTTKGQLELLSQKEGDLQSRWGLGLDHLLGVVAAWLDGKGADGDRLEIYRRTVAYVSQFDRSDDEVEDLLTRLVFPCLDGSFHPGNQCWFSEEIDAGVELEAGAEYVVEAIDEAKKLRAWLEPDPSRRFNLEELFLGRLDEPPRAVERPSSAVIYTWIEALDRIENEQSMLGAQVRELAPEGRYSWKLAVTQALRPIYATPRGEVRLSPSWSGPVVLTDNHAGIVWFRADAVPSLSDYSGLSAFDRRVAEALALGIGVERREAGFSRLTRALRSELERPGRKLKQLREDRERSLLDRYGATTADEDFSRKRDSLKGLKEGTQQWAQLHDELLRIAKEGMLESRRDEMKRIGYEESSLFAEMTQNAEDACLQRQELGMGPPASSTLAIRREGDALHFEHYGRPFNYSRHNGKETPEFSRDIDRITSDRQGFKQQTQNRGAIGRFGVGFKCVYWYTDMPRVHSHIWHFDIESTCIPVEVPAPPDFPALLTRIVLPLRNEAKALPLPTPNEASVLLTFTEHIQSILIEDGVAAVDVRRRTHALGTTGCALTEFTVGDRTLSCGLLLARGAHRVHVTLDTSGLPVRRDDEIPDTFHTFPLTGQRHGLGVAVSAPFMLQSGRAHLAPAQTEENATVIEAFRELLSGIGTALNLAAVQYAQGTSPADWYKAFWHIWDCDSSADGPLRDLRVAVAGGLIDLARTSAVVPMCDGELRAITAEIPCGAYRDSIPEAFAEQLAECLTRDGRVAPRIPAASAMVVLNRLGKQLDRLADEAGADRFVVWLDWDALVDLFRGPESMFVVVPSLLNTLAKSLRRAEGWDDNLRRAAIGMLSQSWLPDHDGVGREAREIVNADSLTEKGLPDFALDMMPRLHGALDALAVELLGGAGLRSGVTWEEFSTFMDASNDFDDAKALLAFLGETEIWQKWDAHKQQLREGRWIALEGNRWSLVDPQTADAWRGLPTEFLEWLELVRVEPVILLPSPVVAPPVTHDPRQVLEAICAWWGRERATLVSEYEEALYPEGAPLPLTWGPGGDIDRRRAWTTLFVLAMSQTLGWTIAGKQQEITRKLIERGFMDVFAGANSSGEDWIRVLDEHLLGRLDETRRFSHWLQLFWRIRSMANPDWLEVFVNCLEDATKPAGAGLHPTKFLNPRESPIGQSRTDVPNASRALGIGSCFLFRELCRTGMLSQNHFDRFCFVPKGSVRQLVGRICNTEVRYSGDPFATSAEIAGLINTALGRQETFSRCYDLPFLLLSEDSPLGSDRRRSAFGDCASHLVSFHSHEVGEIQRNAEDWDGFREPPVAAAGTSTGWITKNGQRIFIG